MALNGLDVILASGKDFIPHVEMGALRYTERMYAMANRVLTLRDMEGWSPRKISEYIKYRRAQNLSEDTAIPDTKLVRARKASVEPYEVGDRYRISDRRADTDLENIIADVISALGASIGDRQEADLIATASADFIGGNLGSPSTAYSLDLPIDGQHEFKHLARRGQLYHVIHPFQAKAVMKSLVQFSSNNTPLDFKNEAIRTWRVPGFDNLDIVVSDFIPRAIVFKIAVYGTGGTFRLAVLDGDEVGKNITAAIAVSTTPATMVANIKAALEALTFTGNGTWTVTGSAIDNITVTPPTGVLFDADSELRPAQNYTAPHVAGEKSGYDLVTGITGSTNDINGDAFGFKVFEKSASAKSLLFYQPALLLDIRKDIQAFFELTMQGRTAEYSAYRTYGVIAWRPELGMTIETSCASAFATG